jgi:hypothetical protein
LKSIVENWHRVNFALAALMLLFCILQIYAQNWGYSAFDAALVVVNFVEGIWILSHRGKA